jgi:hypothetical protein
MSGASPPEDMSGASPRDHMSGTPPRDETAAAGAADHVYVFKPSLMAAPWELRLGADALTWHSGRREGRMLYSRITRVRLSFRPLTLQTRRFVTELWHRDGPKLSLASTTWVSLVEQAPQDAAYGAFVRALHQRIAAAGGTVSFLAGSPPVLYWPGVVIFAVAVASLAVLIVRALLVDEHAGAALLGGFLALLLWQTGSFFLRNRPGRYRPDALPQWLVPPA